jgi:hypothetical protein
VVDGLSLRGRCGPLRCGPQEGASPTVSVEGEPLRGVVRALPAAFQPARQKVQEPGGGIAERLHRALPRLGLPTASSGAVPVTFNTRSTTV